MDKVNGKALRARDAIVDKMQRKDYVSARTLILEALRVYPRLNQFSEMLTVCEILCSAETVPPGYGNDWYRVLQLLSTAESTAIEVQYQKLVSELEPIKLDFPGTELALNLAADAYSVLSDPAKREAYDSKRNGLRSICGALSNPPNPCSPKRAAHEECGGSEDAAEKMKKICSVKVNSPLLVAKKQQKQKHLVIESNNRIGGSGTMACASPSPSATSAIPPIAPSSPTPSDDPLPPHLPNKDARSSGRFLREMLTPTNQSYFQDAHMYEEFLAGLSTPADKSILVEMSSHEIGSNIAYCSMASMIYFLQFKERSKTMSNELTKKLEMASKERDDLIQKLAEASKEREDLKENLAATSLVCQEAERAALFVRATLSEKEKELEGQKKLARSYQVAARAEADVLAAELQVVAAERDVAVQQAKQEASAYRRDGLIRLGSSLYRMGFDDCSVKHADPNVGSRILETIEAWEENEIKHNRQREAATGASGCSAVKSGWRQQQSGAQKRQRTALPSEGSNL